jgi:adhesin transport system outer membrane protein
VALSGALAGALAAGLAHAQATSPGTTPVMTADNAGLSAAAQQALNANPEVTARFHAYQAAAASVQAARGGWRPRVDLEGTVGRTRDRIDDRNPENQSITQTGVALSVRQLLWDGLATGREVDRRDHEKLARYYEFRDTSEQTVLEVARAWYDVARYRQLVALAEDNYVQHRYAFSQIDSRVRAGVGRGVDLEQSGARLALAESNLDRKSVV